MIEQTLVLVKPDGVQRGLTGEIITRFEKAGLKIIGMKMVWIDEKFARQHYTEDLIKILGEKSKKSFESMNMEFKGTEEEMGKKVHEKLLEYITEGPVVAMVLEGVKSVEIIRKIVGKTGPFDSAPGTIRGDLSHIHLTYANIEGKTVRNLIHASDSPENGKREVELWFKPEEIHTYKTVHEEHVM